MQIDIRVMELLASKLCHDLVSPVSAISNGVELIEDIGGSVVEEAMKLIGDSAGMASRRLRLFRMAYGRAGSEGTLSPNDVRTVAESYLTGGKTSLNWPEGIPDESLVAKRGFLKVVLNLIMLAEEVLAYGGLISLRPALEGEAVVCRFEIVGRNAHLAPAIRAALEGGVEVEDISPRSVQAYIVGRFVEQFALDLTYDESLPDRLDFMLRAKSEPLTV